MSSPRWNTFFPRIQVDTYAQMHTKVKLLGGCRCRPYSLGGDTAKLLGGYISPGFGNPAYSSWFPAISHKIEKTSDENCAWTLLFFFTSLSVVSRLRDIPKKYFEKTEMGGGHKQPLGRQGSPGPTRSGGIMAKLTWPGVGEVAVWSSRKAAICRHTHSIVYAMGGLLSYFILHLICFEWCNFKGNRRSQGGAGGSTLPTEMSQMIKIAYCFFSFSFF